MKVMLVCATFPPDRCGIGDYTAQLARQLREQGTETLVLSARTNDGGSVPGVCRPMRTWSLAEMSHLWRTIVRYDPDVVHVQYPGQSYGRALLPWLIPLIAFVARRTVVQTWHERYSRSRALRVLLKAIVPGGLVVVRPDYVEKLHPMMRWSVRRHGFRYIASGPTIPVCPMEPSALANLRHRYLAGQRRLIVFFGFMYPHKRVELLFDVADPAVDRIVIAGEATPDAQEYRRTLERCASSPRWSGKASIAGYLNAAEAAALLAAADAVVLPFLHGGGNWNTSIHAAVAQGTFVLTTSTERSGYDESTHTYFASPDDIEEMRRAIDRHAMTKRSATRSLVSEWQATAAEHMKLYRELIEDKS